MNVCTVWAIQRSDFQMNATFRSFNYGGGSLPPQKLRYLAISPNKQKELVPLEYIIS